MVAIAPHRPNDIWQATKAAGEGAAYALTWNLRLAAASEKVVWLVARDPADSKSEPDTSLVPDLRYFPSNPATTDSRLEHGHLHYSGWSDVDLDA
jgi:hypothetical protein